MKNLKTLVQAYLDEQSTVWSPTTHKSAVCRFKLLMTDDMELESLNQPLQVYIKLKDERGLSPYTIKTTLVLFAAFVDYLVEREYIKNNQLRMWMKKNKQLFRNAYEDKYTRISWDDFIREYSGAVGEYKTALGLMGFAGCRISELATFDGTTVLGKGNKRRKVFVPVEIKESRISQNNTWLRRRLVHSPHEYRKLAADKWLRSGLDIKTVQTLLGHTSILSTQRYLRPMEQDALQNKLNDIWLDKVV